MPDFGAPPKGFSSGKSINLGATPLTNGLSTSADLDVSGFTTLVILARIGNATTPATASGDLALSVCGYEDDGVTLFPAGIQAGLTQDFVVRSASLTSPYAYIGVRFDVKGLTKVLVKVANLNAAPLQGATAIYFLQR